MCRRDLMQLDVLTSCGSYDVTTPLRNNPVTTTMRQPARLISSALSTIDRGGRNSERFVTRDEWSRDETGHGTVKRSLQRAVSSLRIEAAASRKAGTIVILTMRALVRSELVLTLRAASVRPARSCNGTATPLTPSCISSRR